MKNVFYFKHIFPLGGTEQFLFEVARSYKDYDITIYYDTADEKQLKRLTQYVRCERRIPSQKIVCERAFYNFNIDMIDQVEAKEHIFVCHAIFQELGYKPPIDNPKLTKIIAVSEYAKENIEKYAKLIGVKTPIEVCYNPMVLEPKEKVVHLVSASRLEDETKGKARVFRLIDKLDEYCQKTGRHYIWHMFCDLPKNKISSPNVAIMKPRIDVRPYIADADWVIQLSNDMETFCYTNNEALGYGVPIVTTPLSVNKELNIPKEAIVTIDWDLSNINEVVKEIFERERKPFTYEPPKSGWGNLLVKSKSTYTPQKERFFYVEALDTYQRYGTKDNDLMEIPQVGRRWVVDQFRYASLTGSNIYGKVFVKLVKEVDTPFYSEEEKKVEGAKPKRKTKKKWSK